VTRNRESAAAFAIIAAAGSGERLGAGGPKALVEVAGRPMLAWSLDALRSAVSVGGIAIAAPPGHEEVVEGLCGAGERVVTGGATRSESVSAALEAVSEDSELIAIHDAARPLLTPELVDCLVGALAADESVAGVIAAAPLTDTVKRAGEGRVIAETVDRSTLWAAQTPQVFRVNALREAIGSGRGDAAGASRAPGVPTDEAMLIETLGGRVLLHDAEVPNIKVTTPADLQLVELLLTNSRRESFRTQ